MMYASIREKFIEEHADMPDAVTEKRGNFRVKGKVTVSVALKREGMVKVALTGNNQLRVLRLLRSFPIILNKNSSVESLPLPYAETPP